MHFSVVLGGLAVGLLNFGDKVRPVLVLWCDQGRRKVVGTSGREYDVEL